MNHYHESVLYDKPNIEIEYDKPFEVTEAQYKYCMNNFAGIVAGRKSKGKFYIKLWMMAYKEELQSALNVRR